jgi:tripartite-type tricarboxylate transporter receptor subunit TctC
MHRAILCVLVAVAGSAAGSARAQSVEDFYRGKSIRFLVGYGAGTGYDVYMRVVQRHLGKHIPGKPNVIPENMPGAGGLVMTNYLYNVVPRDGTAIGMPSRELVTEPLFGNKDARYDAQKFGWIGSVSSDVSTCLGWRASGFTSLKDVLTREIKIGANGPQTASAVMPRMLNALVGTKFKIYNGYSDSGAVGLAMEQGEVDGYCGFTLGSVRSARPQWLEKKLVAVITQMGPDKHPDLPDVPNPLDLIKDEASRQAYLLTFGAGKMGRPITAPPGVPADRLKALRDAFQATLKDPEFLADIRKSKIDFDGPSDGESISRLIASFYATPPDVVDRVAKIKNSYD